MGLVYANIRLTNGDDLALVRRKLLDADKARSMVINANADSGAAMLCVNEQVATQLELPVLGRQSAQMAGGGVRELDVVGPVEVRFENRYTNCNALVLPGENQVLLGAIPMEDMDVLIHPREQRLVVNPDHPLMASKPVR
jgi:clan AA aspartic protease